MNREKILEILSQLHPDIVNAISSGEISLEEILGGSISNQDNQLGFEIAQTMISKNKYFVHSRVDIVDKDGQLGTVRSENVWHCGHSQKTYELGGVDSFGHVVCTQCIRYCDRGRHLCCVMDSKILANGLIVCDFHSGIWRFIKSKFEKARVR